MTNDEIYIMLITPRKSGGLQFFNENEFSNKFPELYNLLKSVKIGENMTFKQKLWHCLHNDSTLGLGLCPECGKRCGFINFSKGYHKFCSVKCAQSSKDTIGKKIETNVKRHGVAWYNNPEKSKRTNTERYGSEYIFKSEHFKEKSENTRTERYGDPHYTNRLKCMETTKGRYGDECFFRTDVFKRKSGETKTERYGDKHYTNREKCWKTCKSRYGKRNPFQLDFVKQKSKRTNIAKRGVEYAAQSREFKERSKESMMERHGCEHALQSPEYMEKLEATNMERYGVPYACMRPEARTKCSDSKPNMDFAGLLELNGIPFEREFPLQSYSYDFKVGNILIEIDPTITHNTHTGPFGRKPVTRQYHSEKSETASGNDYVCVHVFDWTDKDALVQSLKNGSVALSGSGLPELHWYHIRKKLHVMKTEKSYDEMISEGYLPVYDDGYALISE